MHIGVLTGMVVNKSHEKCRGDGQGRRAGLAEEEPTKYKHQTSQIHALAVGNLGAIWNYVGGAGNKTWNMRIEALAGHIGGASPDGCLLHLGRDATLPYCRSLATTRHGCDHGGTRRASFWRIPSLRQ